ncbi:TRAP transporter small permease [Castellaniella sp.]|uniref:TRAP transporter small permease subunit n=1 Tax=Castellaniella sp. TaxID=1955812 RepID=UPI002AFDC9FE|nr:TRAP transporter small permease [Castellaniella sp.]
MLDFTRAIARRGLWVGGAIIGITALLISCDIVIRALMHHAIDGTDELARFALAISTTWALAGALLDRAHIRVDTAYNFFPGRMRLALDLLALVSFLVVFALIFQYGLEMVLQSWTSETRSTSALQLPMVIPQAIWLCGIALFLVVDVVLFIAALHLILKGKSSQASALIGMKSADEEVHEEIAAAATQMRTAP